MLVKRVYRSRSMPISTRSVVETRSYFVLRVMCSALIHPCEDTVSTWLRLVQLCTSVLVRTLF